MIYASSNALPAQRVTRRKSARQREISAALAEYLPDPDDWHLQLTFDANGDIPSGVGLHSFATYVDALPALMARRPQTFELLCALELYGTPKCSDFMARRVAGITRGRKPWPHILRPWKTLRELLYHHSECGLIEGSYPRPGWLDAPGPRALVRPPLRNLRFKMARR